MREIMFGFNDGSISTLALLASVTSGALARGQILIAGFSGIIAGAKMVFVGILAAIIPYLIGDILLPIILFQIAC